MKKLFIIIFICFGTLTAQESTLNNMIFTKKIEGQVVYGMLDTENYSKFQVSFAGNLENDCTWMNGKIKLSLKNPNAYENELRLDLEKLLLGYRKEFSFCTISLEGGHASLDDIFISKIQFNGFFNGTHLTFSKGNFMIHSGGYLLDRDLDTFGATLEATYKTIMDLPVSITYSLTDWCAEHDYLISQLHMNYTLPEIMKKSTNVYIGMLRNHKQSKDYGALYVGASLGKIEKARDWSTEVNYQHAQDNSIPCFDYNGIGNGFEIKMAYAITDCFSVKGKVVIAEEDRIELTGAFKW